MGGTKGSNSANRFLQVDLTQSQVTFNKNPSNREKLMKGSVALEKQNHLLFVTGRI